jgi:hypothetical protein
MVHKQKIVCYSKNITKTRGHMSYTKSYKEFANPTCTDEVLDAATLPLDGILVRVVAIRQTSDNWDPVTKLVLAVDTAYGHHNGGARIQQDFCSPEQLKKLGVWLIENADRMGTYVK